MKDKHFKTYDNSTAPIKDNITKTTFQMTFSKSNFMFIGKWIIAFVLVIVLGSQALNGFISSKFTKDSTTETITHEYKKQIGVESFGGNFDFIAEQNSLDFLLDKKIYIQKNKQVVYNPNQFGGKIGKVCLFAGYFLLEAYKNDLMVSRVGSYPMRLGKFLNDYSVVYDNPYFNYFYYAQYYNPNDVDYFIIRDNAGNNSSWQTFFPLGSTDYAENYQVISNFMNYYFTFGDVIEVPIYETTTYTYEVRDNNYNWDDKLKQLSNFKPLFNTNDLFVNEEFYKYSDLITYEFKNTDIEKQNVVNKYKSDERLKILFDNGFISIKGREYNFHLIKEKKDYISYIYFDYDNLNLLDTDIYNAYMYALENYVSSANIENYFTYSKMSFEPKDLLIIMSFPIQIVLNTLYNFGVLVGFITWW